MNDIELLKLAAKAAGVVVPEESAWGGVNEKDGVYVLNMDGTGLLRGWNPLADDGDALRLAVKLNLIVGILCELSGVVEIEHGLDTSGMPRYYLCQEAPEGGDDYAATRRAIVRAAAVIGKEMP